jgi:hypothetical protein
LSGHTVRVLPSFGLPFGPVAVLVGVDVVFVMAVYALFFTALIDHPQLRARRIGAIVEVVVVTSLSAAALFVPYAGEDGERCSGAFGSYGFATDALAAGSESDPCAFAGQVLVTFSWAALLVVAMVVAVWRWSGDS